MADPVRAVASDAEPTARIHTCVRCERIADSARKGGWSVPPVQPARSWVRSGVTYWGALCGECEDVERQSRLAASVGMTRMASKAGAGR